MLADGCGVHLADRVLGDLGQPSREALVHIHTGKETYISFRREGTLRIKVYKNECISFIILQSLL